MLSVWRAANNRDVHQPSMRSVTWDALAARAAAPLSRTTIAGRIKPVNEAASRMTEEMVGT